ncbi:MAG: DUF2075 domain-containing protein [Steroidobacteraceae bacterium]|nr:DUF2075 domain-containing protein [Steroidobacteraceae bacterium]
MIVYHSTKSDFLTTAFTRDIEAVILSAFRARLGHGVAASEVRSWKESLLAMAKVLNAEAIPGDCGVAVEYGIPQTSKRIDVLLSGTDEAGRHNLLIVELKQWEHAKRTPMDGVVRTRFANGEADTSHPSYQSWSYAELLRNFNATVDEADVPLQPCAYLHNCGDGADLRHEFYAYYVERAPLFLAGDAEREKLRAFIARHVRKGDRGELIYRLEQGRIRPSRRLVDALKGMMQGRREFVLIDDQKLVFETALARATAAQAGTKKVVIVEGGPGTGKSVVAVNLLATLIERRLNARYVSKNRAPRQVIEHTLAGVLHRSKISTLFGGSGSFYESPKDEFDVLVVDEAHRLNEKSGLFSNLGEHQVSEIIRASRCAIFFIDEDQRVTWKDVGSAEDIAARARAEGAEVTRLQLASQFRCSGSDGYLAWLDDVLGIRGTANPILDTRDYDFRVYDDPNALRREIERLNAPANRARMVAGYCWDWKSKTKPDEVDVTIPEHGFGMRWNLASDEGLWITAKESVKEIGCIHTCQGLEVDYVGVIVGPDLIVRNGEVITRPEMRSRQDQSIKGYKAEARRDPEGARKKADAIVRNTYRTLMTRGMKGCYVYCVDAELHRHLAGRISADLPSTAFLRAADGDESYRAP